MYSDRIVLGVDFLNRLASKGFIPVKWWFEIDTDALEMESGVQCVLGQLFNDDAVLANKVGSTYFGHGYDFALGEHMDNDEDVAREYGFNLSWSQDFDILRDEWIDAIDLLRRMYP